ncbi:MAG: aminodeoxychorismate/anthranilate synthase component II [Saprospiraceae bacterium]|nr:aminodeoxychorismate/anthranilate synthase component II [Saprospiraceae bacterium]
MKVLLIDNFDSFTYNLEHYLLLAGLEVTTYRNTEIPFELILEESISFDGMVISPGPMRPQDHPGMIRAIREFIGKIPILGVCLGMQAIGEYYGWKLVHAPVPMHGKTSLITHLETGIFDGIPNPVEVMRYHSLVLEAKAGSNLEVISTTVQDQLVMGICNPKIKVTGIQFHPESILTPSGQLMLNNWSKHLKNDKESDYLRGE